MNANNNLDSPPESATFGQDASFRLEQPMGAMSISPSGRDVVLASKEGLHIIDLDSPFSPPRYLPHRTPWEVADVQWSPFAIKDHWIVSTSNQKALVWNVGISGWRDSIEFVLHGHTRAITDINFSAHDPEMLATCAVDSFVHAWDLRAPARPAFSFSDWFAGATQVKWSRQDEHVIASSHDRFLHIWDKRKGAYPARTLEAHDTKIYGIDWNRFEPSKIVTCALDKTIKFWNIDNTDDVPERVIETPFPVWRARHTPFGWGLLAMPQRSSSELCLYDRRPVDGTLQSGLVKPTATFSGHRGQVKEFLWRARGTISDGTDNRDFQLVTWGNDGELKLHSISKNTFQAIGYEKGVTRPLRLNFTRRNAKYRTFRHIAHEPHSPLDMPGRTDSNQSHHQSFGVRGRQSTNIGMNKMAVAQFRGWLNGGKREKRTGMHGRSTVRQDMNPIAWMKNVKILSYDSDSLADEITQVEERFSRLEFESVDIGQRKVVISFQAPWGDKDAMVYTRVDFRFPRTYPKDVPAIVTIYKTSSINEETHKILSTEVHTISETYASRQRGCVEAVVRYLLHDQSMEQIVSWLLEENLSHQKLMSEAELSDDLSSDSDDDNLDGNQDPSNSSANLRVPIAKGCGALWSTTGELVCFFPVKQKEPVSILGSLGGIEDIQSSRLFENFGRLQTHSPARRPGNGTQPTIDDGGSDFSDVSSTFSSTSSSSSSSDIGAMRNAFAPYGNAINLAMRERSGSAGGSNKSTTLDGTKIGDETRLNFVSIKHDVKRFLPSQRLLAEQYRISGQGFEICEENALVAERAHRPDTASVWRLASLMLQRRVPLEVLKSLDSSEGDIMVIVRRTASQLQRKDSGIDLSYDAIDTRSEAGLMGCLRWGNSPLGSRYLLKAIFTHFERHADIQTLAMLSCVFSEFDNPKANRLGIYSAINPQHSYQPSVEIATSQLNIRDAPNSRFTFALTKPLVSGKHFGSIAIPTVREPHNRRRNTASIAVHSDEQDYRDINISIDPTNSEATLGKTDTMSVSPEESRFNRRTNSGVAFAASRASLSALAQSFQQSPPSNSSTAGSSLKKFSPSTTSGWAGSLFGSAQTSRASRASQAPSEANSDEASGSNLRGSMSLANLQDLRKDSRRLRGSRGSPVTSNTATAKAPAESNKSAVSDGKSKKRKIKLTLYNQGHFDLDGHAEGPLLDPDLDWKYKTWRSAYADQLGAWGLFLQRAEMLQFDNGHVSEKETQRTSGRAKAPTPKLEITKCCIECGNTFAPIEKNGVPIGWHCTSISCLFSTEKLSKNQICSICQHLVQGLSIPCLQCGHMTCYDCAQGWFADIGIPPTPNDQSDDVSHDEAPLRNYCPTGCGCLCPTLQSIKAPSPPKTTEDSVQHLAPTPISRQTSNVSTRSQRHKSEAPPESVFSATMMALSRSRAASTTTTRTAVIAEPDTQGHPHAHGQTHAHGSGYTHGHSHSDANSIDELLPWSSGKFTSLGRGIGGGLSRGLSNRSSDATIRKA